MVWPMRAGIVLEALAAYHRVSVLVAPLYTPFESEMPVELRNLCVQARPHTPIPTSM